MSSSFKRMLAFLLASAACWSLALTIVSIHWWHFFNSSCNSNKLLHSCKYLNQFYQSKHSIYQQQINEQNEIHFLTLSAMVAIYLMHSISDGNWFTSFTIYCTTFTWPWKFRHNCVSRVWKVCEAWHAKILLGHSLHLSKSSHEWSNLPVVCCIHVSTCMYQKLDHVKMTTVCS